MVVTPSDTSLPVRDNLRYLWLARYRLVILPVLAAGVWVVMLVAAILLRFELSTELVGWPGGRGALGTQARPLLPHFAWALPYI